VARGNEKGRVERAIRYVREAFFAGRDVRDLDDLNAQADTWCQGPAMERPWPEDRSRRVGEVFKQERAHLLALPSNPFPSEERLAVRVGKTPYVRFDLNDYSLPHTHVRRTLEVAATLTTVRILEGATVLATHPRSFDRGAQIEDPAHIQALVANKRAAREHRGLDRLQHAAPSARAFFVTAAERGLNLGALTRGLTHLLDTHGPAALESALAAALAQRNTHLGAVRQLLDQQRHARGQPPPVAVTLPDDPRLRHLHVQPHALGDYEALARRDGDDESDA